MKVIITHFEPFNGRETNASKEVVLSLKGDYEIRSLPVSWKRVVPFIDEILKEEPGYLFLVGEAGKYLDVTVEKYAHNISNGKDIDGEEKNEEAIAEGKPFTLSTTFDLSKLEATFSEDAGKYLCNFSYYYSLSNNKKSKIVFIHVPYVDDQNKKLEVINKTQKIIETLIETS